MNATRHELLARFPRPGRVEWIGLRPTRRAALEIAAQAEAIAGGGLAGDRACGGARGVTLIQAEHLPAIAACYHRPTRIFARAAMLDVPFALAVNHVLDQSPWAKERLTRFAGRTAALSVFPLTHRLTVNEDGSVSAAPADAPAAASVALSPPAFARLMAGDASARQEAQVAGDTGFAEEIAYLAQHLRWDAEEDLSKVVGDVAAHRMGEAARGFTEWSRQAAQNLGENLRDYWVQEQPVIAGRPAIEKFVADVDTLRDDVERLAKRIERLEKS